MRHSLPFLSYSCVRGGPPLPPPSRASGKPLPVLNESGSGSSRRGGGQAGSLVRFAFLAASALRRPPLGHSQREPVAAACRNDEFGDELRNSTTTNVGQMSDGRAVWT